MVDGRGMGAASAPALRHPRERRLCQRRVAWGASTDYPRLHLPRDQCLKQEELQLTTNVNTTINCVTEE